MPLRPFLFISVSSSTYHRSQGWELLGSTYFPCPYLSGHTPKFVGLSHTSMTRVYFLIYILIQHFKGSNSTAGATALRFR